MVKIIGNTVMLSESNLKKLKPLLLDQLESNFQDKLDYFDLKSLEEVSEKTNIITGATIHGNSNMASLLNDELYGLKGEEDTNKKAMSQFSGKVLGNIMWRGLPIIFSGHFGNKKTISFQVKGNL